MILGAIAIALALWAFTFGFSWGNFWWKITLSASALCCYSLIWRKPKFQVTFEAVSIGLLSAAVLYGIFFVGHRLAPLFIPASHAQVNNIYALGIGESRTLVFLLLFIVTGPAEEIFWRGFLQGHLMERWGNALGFLSATLIYGGVHIFSFNLMLILAALVAGAYWGALYLWRRDLVVQIVSHSFWSAFIFAVAPVT